MLFSVFSNKRPLEDVSTSRRSDLVLLCDCARPQTRRSIKHPHLTLSSPQQRLPTPQAFQEGFQDSPLTGIHGRAEESQWLHLAAQVGHWRATKVPPHKCFDIHETKATPRVRRLCGRLSLLGLASACHATSSRRVMLTCDIIGVKRRTMQEIHRRWERTVGKDVLLSTGKHIRQGEKCSEVTFTHFTDTSTHYWMCSRWPRQCHSPIA